MQYADTSELVAAIVARKHTCGPECLCLHLRKIPEIRYALEKMGVKPAGRSVFQRVEMWIAESVRI